MGEPVEDRELLNLFLEETRERLEALEPALVELERAGAADRVRLLEEIFRQLHSTKGNAGYLGLADLVNLVHAAEQVADALRKGAELRTEHVDLLLQTATLLKSCLAALASDGPWPSGLGQLAAQLEVAARNEKTAGSPQVQPAPSPEPAAPAPASGEGGDSRASSAPDTELFASTVRVPVEVVDQLGRLAEEMLVTRNRVSSLASTFQDRELASTSKKLSLMVSELQDVAALTRLQPISHLFSQVPRVARDVGRATGKEVEVVLEGGKLEVDRRILQELRDPLVHLLRNAVDHGLETPSQRMAAGKPSKGRLSVRATRTGANLVLEVEDDGAGIDYDAVRAKAVERGLVPAREAAALGEAELANLLLRSGFSTRDKATAVSGRGVGLDVVATRLLELGGLLVIHSVRGQGTTMRLTVPTSVSVVNALVFDARGYLLGLPYDSVQEIVLIHEDQVERYGTQEVFRLRNQLVPLFTLSQWPDRRPEREATGRRHILVLRNGRATAGLWCDGVARLEELIVKPALGIARGMHVISGLASLGTGEIVLILDPERLLQEAGLPPDAIEEGANAEGPASSGAAADDWADRMVLVRGYGQYRYAIPVRLVSRIVQFGPSELVAVGERTYLQQSGGLVPLLDLDQTLGLRAGGEGAGIALLLSSGSHQAALATSQVVRIGSVAVRPEPSEHRGVTGLLNLEDGVYLLVDVPGLLHEHVPAFFADQGAGQAEGLGGRVLLVEDSVLFRESLQAALRNAGCAVAASGTAEAALETLSELANVDLVITDYVLPGQSGLDLIRAIRTGGAGAARDVPILVMSQYLAKQPELVERMRAAGADEVVAKFDELDQNGLLSMVRRLMRRQRGPAGGASAEAGPGATEETCHVLAVHLGDEVYGVPVAQVREITTLDGLTPTPLRQEGFLGLANIRGEIIPVFDLGGVLGRPSRAESRRQVYVVVVTGSGPMVLRSDGIRGTIKVPLSALQQPKGNLGSLAEVVRAVVILPDCLLQVLDLDQVGARGLGHR